MGPWIHVMVVIAGAFLVAFAGFLIGELHGMGYYWPSLLRSIGACEELRARLADIESPEWEEGGGI